MGVGDGVSVGDGVGVGEGAVWSGGWVTERLGLELTGSPALRDLLGLAVRDNPKRAQLLVSRVLGKHVPQRPGWCSAPGGGWAPRCASGWGRERRWRRGQGCGRLIR